MSIAVFAAGSCWRLRTYYLLKRAVHSMQSSGALQPISAQMDDRQSEKGAASEHYSPVFLEYSLMKEFVHLQQQSPTGVYVVPSHASPFRWFAVLFVDRGIYSGAVVRFTLQIPFDYPNCFAPKVIFEPVIFHPLINEQNGELYTKQIFSGWNSNERRVAEVVLFVKSMFTAVDSVLQEQFIEDNSTDFSAIFYAQNLKLYKSNFSEFKKKAIASVDECRSKIYESYSDDRNAVYFGPWNPDIHEEFRKKLVSGQNIADILEIASDNRNTCYAGLSWVQKGSSQMFSKSNC